MREGVQVCKNQRNQGLITGKNCYASPTRLPRYVSNFNQNFLSVTRNLILIITQRESHHVPWLEGFNSIWKVRAIERVLCLAEILTKLHRTPLASKSFCFLCHGFRVIWEKCHESRSYIICIFIFTNTKQPSFCASYSYEGYNDGASF